MKWCDDKFLLCNGGKLGLAGLLQLKRHYLINIGEGNASINSTKRRFSSEYGIFIWFWDISFIDLVEDFGLVEKSVITKFSTKPSFCCIRFLDVEDTCIAAAWLRVQLSRKGLSRNNE